MIGLDFGTSNYCVAAWQNDTVQILDKSPSFVAFTNDGHLVGSDADAIQIIANPANTVFSVKRLLGCKFSDASVHEGMTHWPFKVVADHRSNRPLIEVQHRGAIKTFYPEEVTAMVLAAMIKKAEVHLGKKITSAVLAVPVGSNGSQRQAIKDAAKIAGLEALRVISEPVAAAMAYGLISKTARGRERNVLIVNLGGGALDVALVTLANGIFEVKAVGGDAHLGGDDFDLRLVKHLMAEFSRQHSEEIAGSQRAINRLRVACERAKHTLSLFEQATIEVDAFVDHIDLQLTIRRDRFEELCADLFARVPTAIAKVLQDGWTKKSFVHDVVLVGGSTRIPKVQQLVSHFFDGKELNMSINPDEAVAYGAAVQAFILTGGKSKQTEGLLLLDVTPLTLGIETAGGVMTALIKRNQTIPTKKSCILKTYVDNQPAVYFNIYEGERCMAKDCNYLGTLILPGIPPAPAGSPVEVFFDLDSYHNFTISAEVTGGPRSEMTIKTDASSLTLDVVQLLRRADAKKELLNHVNWIHITVQNAPAEIFNSELERQIILNAVRGQLQWLEGNEETSEEGIANRRKELDAICIPYLSRLFPPRH